MIMKVILTDGSWFVGDRNRKAIGYLYNHETFGTHHFFVVDGDTFFEKLIGQEIAVPICQVRLFILDFKR
jgi:hypothetical protein